MVLRQEGDIIAQTLAHLLTWADHVYIYDTGSTDNTWEIVHDFAARDRRIIAIASEPVLFSDSIRPWLFHRFRHRMRPGDWIARIDADEQDYISPPQFVRERLSRHEGRLYSCQYDFMLARQELKAWQDGRETIADRARPIRDRRRYFRFDPYGEQRLFRYRRGTPWPINSIDATYTGILARERIPVLHYRARDPLQVQVRCAIRQPIADAGARVGWHWKIPDWRAWVFAENDPTMVHWPPGEPLPEHPHRYSPIEPRQRIKECLLYRAGLVHFRDRRQTPFPSDYRPQPLAESIHRQITENLVRLSDRPYLRDTPPQLADRRERNSQMATGK